jgi:hypothetical protein
VAGGDGTIKMVAEAMENYDVIMVFYQQVRLMV